VSDRGVLAARAIDAACSVLCWAAASTAFPGSYDG
jgi:hypothetical protein